MDQASAALKGAAEVAGPEKVSARRYSQNWNRALQCPTAWIFTSFSRGVVNGLFLTTCSSANVRYGSLADIVAMCLLRPLLGVKETKLARKRTSRSNVCYRGQSGPTASVTGESAYSHKQTYATLQQQPHFGTLRCRW